MGLVSHLLGIALVAASAAPVVGAGAKWQPEATQQQLDADCDVAREKRLAPERARLIDECVREKFRDTLEECERFYWDHGAKSGGRAPLYFDLPECIRAFEYREGRQP